MTITTLSTTAVTARRLPDQALVCVSGSFYAVDLGPQVRPRHHRVGLDARCTCSLGADCPAVACVRQYLAAGGLRAERPPFGYYPVAPAKCPLCGAGAVFDASLSSPHRGAGWRCTAGGKSHYWGQRARISAQRRQGGKHAPA